MELDLSRFKDESKKLSGQHFEERDFGGPKIKQLLHFNS
jgi:hypothetical protein